MDKSTIQYVNTRALHLDVNFPESIATKLEAYNSLDWFFML